MNFVDDYKISFSGKLFLVIKHLSKKLKENNKEVSLENIEKDLKAWIVSRNSEEQKYFENYEKEVLPGLLEGLNISIQIVKPVEKPKGILGKLAGLCGDKGILSVIVDSSGNFSGNSLPVKVDVDSVGNFSANSFTGNEFVFIKNGK
jgi:hypothetical protein